MNAFATGKLNKTAKNNISSLVADIVNAVESEVIINVIRRYILGSYLGSNKALEKS